MFLSRSDYDRGVNTFSPAGRLFQVEYAMKAIELGTTAIGIQTTEGVVLAVEKRISSKLLEPSSIKKISEVDTHIGCAMSGLTADARTLIDHARVECQNHWFTYDVQMPVESCAQSVSDLALGFGEEGGMSRPFGVALLIAGCDKQGGPQLWHTDPSGTFTRYGAKAIGAGSESGQISLQEEFNKSMTLAEAKKLALQTLKQVMEDKISPTSVEVAVVNAADSKYHVLDDDEVKGLLDQLAADPLAEARQASAASASSS